MTVTLEAVVRCWLSPPSTLHNLIPFHAIHPSLSDNVIEARPDNDVRDCAGLAPLGSREEDAVLVGVEHQHEQSRASCSCPFRRSLPLLLPPLRAALAWKSRSPTTYSIPVRAWREGFHLR